MDADQLKLVGIVITLAAIPYFREWFLPILYGNPKLVTCCRALVMTFAVIGGTTWAAFYGWPIAVWLAS